MSSKEIPKKTDFITRARGDVPYLYIDRTSALHCDKCKDRLGLFRMVRRALFKHKGEPYEVLCKSCGHMNPRKKGEIGKELDERWGE